MIKKAKDKLGNHQSCGFIVVDFRGLNLSETLN